MRIITIGTLKGGVGKSTTAVTLASILATEYRKKVLLIDADPQANTSSFMGLDETSEDYLSVKDIFEDSNVKIQNVIKKTNIENLNIIGSTILLTATDMKLVTLAAREYVLKRFFSKNREFLNLYDYVICDTSPNMSVTNQNFFAISDCIILVSDVGISAFKGIELFTFLWGDICEKLGLQNNVKALLLTKVKKQTKISKEYHQYLIGEDLTKNLLLNTYIKDTVKFSEAELEHLPINLYAGDTNAAEEYRGVVRELLERDVL